MYSINHHLVWPYLSGYSLKMAACMPMEISDPDSPPPRLQLFLCPLPLKVSASCGGGHSKWAYISYWDLGRIEQMFELNEWMNELSSIKSNTGIQAGILWQQITLLDIPCHKVLYGTTIIILVYWSAVNITISVQLYSVHSPIQNKGRVRGHTHPLHNGHSFQPHFQARDYS